MMSKKHRGSPRAAPVLHSKKEPAKGCRLEKWHTMLGGKGSQEEISHAPRGTATVDGTIPMSLSFGVGERKKMGGGELAYLHPTAQKLLSESYHGFPKAPSFKEETLFEFPSAFISRIICKGPLFVPVLFFAHAYVQQMNTVDGRNPDLGNPGRMTSRKYH